jgi:hypothetical protein
MGRAARAWAGRPRGRGRLRRRLSLGLQIIISSEQLLAASGTHAVIIPEDESLSWFSLPMPRFVNPGALRRALELNRDWESGPESLLAFFSGAEEETLVVVVTAFLMIRSCRG